ncbi:alpha/beta hydrolase [Tessaracoccus palaemonis]|uniref:Dienelactone hydrolase family protein n=1 Tax=Tessaracoccus palaemonis TaxID=2829499 RepID=A0ABX8SGQ0_9ACTN|nr:dienelactone hydrolase family protein [Tessaracoccus palaemonis]QXT62486.1 dienelactone hydrolase family protein [Tessaracoccus palaemonis]
MRIDQAVGSRGFDPAAPIVTVLLHGFGADERDLATIGEALYLPWISPRAPLPVQGGGAAWFNLGYPSDVDEVTAATEALWALLDEVLDPATRILAVGFSQGGLMATQLLRTRPERIAGTVILSGFLLDAEQPADAQLAESRPPVFYGRGELDRIIPPQAVSGLLDWLPGHADATVFAYPGLEHGTSSTEMQDLTDFLRSTGIVE